MLTIAGRLLNKIEQNQFTVVPSIPGPCQGVVLWAALRLTMILSVSPSRPKGFRFRLSGVSYAVWAYHRFNLSLRDVEGLLAERGVIVSYETIRVWMTRFGPDVAGRMRAARAKVKDKWH